MAAKINSNFGNVSESYLFAEVARQVAEFQKANPDRKVIRMGIGDVTRPLAKTVVQAMEEASREQGVAETFHGYGPEQGYDFLKESIRKYYEGYGVKLDPDEIFVSDGAKSDCGNILNLFSEDNLVLVPDPVYPVYVDTNTMDGRRVIFAEANEDNGFLPMPEDVKTEKEGEVPDIIYLCSPNNPTGAVYNHEQLKVWVDYANAHGSVILFDAAYECFVTGDMPHSIFEIEGARTCAIEICSFSKTAGFTGTRCGYTVVPMDLVRDDRSLNKMWLRRQCTKFNGAAYIVQRGAAAVFTPEGEKEVKENIDYYRENAKIMTETMDKLGFFYTGGKNSPYVWFKCPNGMESWEFFRLMLNELGIVGTPGAGFGPAGKNFLRLTAFSTREATEEAMQKFYDYFKKN